MKNLVVIATTLLLFNPLVSMEQEIPTLKTMNYNITTVQKPAFITIINKIQNKNIMLHVEDRVLERIYRNILRANEGVQVYPYSENQSLLSPIGIDRSKEAMLYIGINAQIPNVLEYYQRKIELHIGTNSTIQFGDAIHFLYDKDTDKINIIHNTTLLKTLTMPKPIILGLCEPEKK